ncbi:MAG: hypothetical protein LBJ11_00160 [Oscillospiraceae bacterium]|jgi:hypothetical protein|nr:hypothetical protein [Oscillospiraceae bacterium]
MKTTRKTLSVLLALALLSLALFGFTGCDLFPPDEPTEALSAATPYAQASQSPLAYFNQVVADTAKSQKHNEDFSYSVDDIASGNDVLKAASGALKKYLIKYLHHDAEVKDFAASAPLLRNPLREDDVLDIKLEEQWDIKMRDKLAEMQLELEEGRNTSYAKLSPEDMRKEAEELLGEATKAEAEKWYEIRITFQPLTEEQAARYLAPADKAAILEQLDIAKDYLTIQDYTKVPKEVPASDVEGDITEARHAYTIFCRVEKQTDHIAELTLTEVSIINTAAVGVNTLADVGNITLSFQLTQTARFSGFDWPEEKTTVKAQ